MTYAVQSPQGGAYRQPMQRAVPMAGPMMGGGMAMAAAPGSIPVRGPPPPPPPRGVRAPVYADRAYQRGPGVGDRGRPVGGRGPAGAGRGASYGGGRTPDDGYSLKRRPSTAPAAAAKRTRTETADTPEAAADIKVW
eukprot:361500-Chlamydomonas_euryale.AAC.5